LKLSTWKGAARGSHTLKIHDPWNFPNKMVEFGGRKITHHHVRCQEYFNMDFGTKQLNLQFFRLQFGRIPGWFLLKDLKVHTPPFVPLFEGFC